MPKKPFTLPNGRCWPSRQEAIAHFSEMLSRYDLDETVSPGPDHDDLLALLAHYDRDVPMGKETKLGVGVERFAKGQKRGEGFTTPCFVVHRLDGSSDDFSFFKAIRS